MSVALRKRGRLAAALSITHSESRKWTDAQLQLLEEVSERTWDAVERARAEQALRETEERQAFLLQLSDALRPLGDAAAIERKACELLGDRLDTDHTYYAEINVATDYGVVCYDHVRNGAVPFVAEYRISDLGFVIPLYQRGEPVVVNDVFTSPLIPDADRLNTAASHISWIAVPVIKDGLLVGTFCTAMSRVRQWTRLEVEITAETAERVWSAIELARAQRALREADERLRALADAAPVLLWQTDETGIMFTNEQYTDFFGTDFETIRCMGWTRFLHPDDAESYLAAYTDAHARRDSYTYEARFRRADGEYRWLLNTAHPLNSHGFVGASTDITEHKHAEEALRVGEERYRVALQSAEMAAWDWDITQDQVRWDDQHFLLLGLQPEDRLLQADFFLQFVYPDDLPLIHKEMLQAVEETGHYQVDAFRIVRADGVIRWMSRYGQTVNWNHGKSARMVGVMFDITERKILEQQKEQFIGIASHELRTPVTSIKAYTEILEEIFAKNGDKQNAALMQKLDVQVDRLTSLIYALLDTTRITEGKLQLKKTDFDMDELITDTAETMQRIAGKHRIELQLAAHLTIYADRERIRQVLPNLISNAIKYSPDADHIVVRSASNEQEVTVCVQDFGIGIPEEAQHQLFNRFFRGKEASSISGLGLGLFISSSIIKEHGGNIRVESLQGQGALFYFTLPIAME